MTLVCDNLDCDGKTLSIIEYDGGVWFVGAQLAQRLGYSRSSILLRRHCPDKVLKRTSDLKKAGVPAKGSKETYIVPFETAVRVVMRCDLPESDNFRKLFLFVVIPYVFSHHSRMFGTEGAFTEESMAVLHGALATSMRDRDVVTATRVIGEYKIKQVGK